MNKGGMCNSILVQGCKSRTFVEDCSKTYHTTVPMMKFSQFIFRDESSLELKSQKKFCKTDFELFLISHFLSLQKICHTDFYLTLHEY